MVYIIMKKIFILTIFILFLTGCSNLGRKEELTLKEKESLIILVESIKNELKIGRTALLEKSLAPSIKNNFVKDEIQNINFSNVNIFNSKPQFLNNRATNIVGVNIRSMTIYYEVEYIFEDGAWKILKFKERRR